MPSRVKRQCFPKNLYFLPICFVKSLTQANKLYTAFPTQSNIFNFIPALNSYRINCLKFFILRDRMHDKWEGHNKLIELIMEPFIKYVFTVLATTFLPTFGVIRFKHAEKSLRTKIAYLLLPK